MAEYRVDELAEISGISARNIRAYRERGLLDPPRRVGRSALYDDYHLSQLRTINQLHRRGFSSAHIAEFFASLRRGADLADILGIQRAVLGSRTDAAGEDSPRHAASDELDIAADSAEARRLIEYGMAEIVDGAVVLTDPDMAQIVTAAADPLGHVRTLLQICDVTREPIDGLAAAFAHALDTCVVARFGENHATDSAEGDLGRVIRDYRDLWATVVASRLDEALRRHVALAVGNSRRR